jgi:fatty acyl-CoA reductase
MASPVAEFYKKKSIFITGATGFLGIALIEKLLRTCTDLTSIYLLLRPKKGKTVEERLEEITNNLIFEKFLETNSRDAFKKLIPITGDVGEERLGLSDTDRQTLINNVNVVIHSAATLDFQQPLKPTVFINLLGTRRVLELCAEIKNLSSMVHVSSAYVNSYLLKTEEILYPAPEDAEKIINLAQTLNDEALNELTPGILKDHPNTYTFTKHLAEHEVNKYATKFPVGIVRPSMIVGAWQEPVPGWTISKNGPQGFLMGAAKGIVRRLPLAENLVVDYIPVDVVVNHCLITAQYVADKKSNDLTIFHCTSSTRNPFKWAHISDKINANLHKYPLKSAVWYPHLKFVSSLWLFKISAIFMHFIPAYILDFVTRISGGRPILVRLHTNVWNSLNLLEKFIFTEWFFDSANTKKLIDKLTEADKKNFQIDITDLSWQDFFKNLNLGVRRYLNNEHEKTLPAARKKDTILFMMHCVLQATIYGGLWWLTSTVIGIPLTKCFYVIPILHIILSFL